MHCQEPNPTIEPVAAPSGQSGSHTDGLGSWVRLQSRRVTNGSLRLLWSVSVIMDEKTTLGGQSIRNDADLAPPSPQSGNIVPQRVLMIAISRRIADAYC